MLETVRTVKIVGTMKTISIDEEVVEHLRKNVRDFEETPNSVLRRLLHLGAPVGGMAPAPKTPVDEFISSSEFRFARGAVGRFVASLAWLYQQHRERFDVVVRIRGRGRLYFATSADELERSGKSVNPKQIPGSPYWVITTTPTSLKQEILAEVMKALNHDDNSTRALTDALEV